MKSISILTFFSVCAISTVSTLNLCENWEPFKNEKCFKIFGLAEHQSFADAAKTCNQNGATLITIHSKDEQEFLTNFLFNKSKVVDNVWIGARTIGSNEFQWQDKSSVAFKNWVTGCPRNLADYCVQLLSDVGLAGKWVDAPCARENLVVCQRRPTWSQKLLEETVIELTYGMQQTNQKLVETELNLKEVKENQVPVGFTYFQLPKDKSPQEIWPSMRWTDVSTDYAGVFFRVEGGAAATFGQMQHSDAPRLTGVKYSYDLKNKGITEIETKLGDWSDWCTTAAQGNTEYRANSYKMSNGEVRPVNMAIRIWKRTN